MAKKVNLAKGVDVEGFEEMSADFERLKSRVQQEEVKKVLYSGAVIFRDKAKANAPVKTGRLRDSIFAAIGKKVAKGEEINVVVGVKYGKGGAPHAHLVEFGTSRAPKHPFMRPALAETKSDMAEKIKEGMTALLDKAAER